MTKPTRHFFTSDLHLGHTLVAGKRGFWNEDVVTDLDESVPDVDEHDAVLAANWDEIVRPRDVVWILGDISIEGTAQRALDWLDKRAGRKRLVLGNHDRPHPVFKDAHVHFPRWAPHFETITTGAQKVLKGQTVLMSHFPYAEYADGPRRKHSTPGQGRMNQWRLPDLGAPLLHGHTHDAEVKAHDRSFHVGVDAHDFKLVDQEEVLAWLDTL